MYTTGVLQKSSRPLPSATSRLVCRILLAMTLLSLRLVLLGAQGLLCLDFLVDEFTRFLLLTSLEYLVRHPLADFVVVAAAED